MACRSPSSLSLSRCTSSSVSFLPLALVVDRPALDRHVVRHRERPLVRLVGIADDLDVHLLLVGRHQDEAHVRVVAERLVGADRGDDVLRVGVQRPVRDDQVPGVVRRKDLQGRAGWRRPRACRTAPACRSSASSRPGCGSSRAGSPPTLAGGSAKAGTDRRAAPIRRGAIRSVFTRSLRGGSGLSSPHGGEGPGVRGSGLLSPHPQPLSPEGRGACERWVNRKCYCRGCGRADSGRRRQLDVTLSV